MPDPLKYILALDAAMNGCSAAVMEVATGKIISDTRAMARGQSEMLVPMVQGVVERAGIGFEDIGLICTTVGPGAFTGLRIGLSTARSFGLALGVKVTGVLTTGVIARALAEKMSSNKDILVVLETKREDFYAHIFDKAGAAIGEPVTGIAADLVTRFGTDAFIVCGDGVERLKSECSWPQGWDAAAGYELPDPEIMARMALEQWEAGTLTEAIPVYLRNADVSQSKKIMRTIASGE